MKEYNKLPRGNYVFKVKARSLLEKNIVTCSYEFTILPAWYESTLAFIIYFILVLIAIGATLIWVNKKSTKGAREMELLKEKEIQEQKKVFEAENQAKKKEIKELKNQQLQYELRHKAQELASSTMNLIRKNEMLADIMGNITKATEEIKKNGDVNAVLTRLGKMERNIKQNIEQDKNWKRFEENFDLVYENYLKRLGESYPELNMSDKKICAYIKMDLSSKDMAPLLNMSVRSIETNRYRIRQKLSLGRDVNLSDFLQKF
jgi:DNA-binding CsgD family transcriptional regulator